MFKKASRREQRLTTMLGSVTEILLGSTSNCTHCVRVAVKRWGSAARGHSLSLQHLRAQKPKGVGSKIREVCTTLRLPLFLLNSFSFFFSGAQKRHLWVGGQSEAGTMRQNVYPRSLLGWGGIIAVPAAQLITKSRHRKDILYVGKLTELRSKGRGQ